MTTFPFRPGRDFALLRREMDRLFDDATAGDRPSTRTVWCPRADVAEADDAYLLTLDLPGIDRDALDVTFDDGTLKISGERQHFAERTGAHAHRIERAHGRFFRSFVLGTDVDPEAIKASYDDGVLSVRIGKSEARQPRRIAVGSRTPDRRELSEGDGHATQAERMEA